MEELREYAYLWGKKKDRYVLLKIENGYSIICLSREGDKFCLIEDDYIADKITNKMIECGNKIFETIDELELYKNSIYN